MDNQAQVLMQQRRDIINEVIQIEGGFVDDPADSGGATKFGITHAVASKHGYGVRSLTQEQAYQIYEADYWSPLRLDDVLPLSTKLAAELFDTGVNTGTGRAGQFLQRALNAMNNGGRYFPDLVVDGVVGDKTLAALAAFLRHRGAPGETVLFNLLNSLQSSFYLELAERRPKDEKFQYGWQANRVRMEEGPAPEPEHPKAQAAQVEAVQMNELPDDLYTSSPVQQRPFNSPPPLSSSTQKGSGFLVRAVNWLNPLDWFPGWGTYISTGAAAALALVDVFGVNVDPTLYGIIAAFAGARLRRGMARQTGRL